MTKLELWQVRDRINEIQANLNNPVDLSDCQIEYYVAELGLLVEFCENQYNKTRAQELGLRLIQGGK